MKTLFTKLFIFIFTSLFLNATAQITPVYVKYNAMGNNDGTSWENAFIDLQDALNAVPPPEVIWVAQGTYKPDTMNGDPEQAFSIQNEVELLGGFIGEGISPDDRNPALYKTILSGDLNGNDEMNNFDTLREDNVNTVLTINWGMTNSTIIDGFTISSGHADDSQNNTGRNGGGIYCSGAPIIRNCIISQNYAEDIGGGIRATNIPFDDALIIENCVFDWNYGNLGGGADIRNCDVSFLDCTFSNNQAKETVDQNLEKNGGGVFTSNTNCIYKNCNFVSNTCNGGGGAFFYWTNASGTGLTLEVDSCIFSNNSASGGGALFTQIWGKDQTTSLTNSRFTDNQCTNWWGNVAIYHQENGAYGTALVDHCEFENNISQGHGSAGIDIGSGQGALPSAYSITNCTFKNNLSDTIGGALSLWSEIHTVADFEVKNCHFENNKADTLAGALWILTGSDDFSATISQCEFNDNESKIGAAIATSTKELEIPNVPTEAQLIIDNCLLYGSSGENTVEVKNFPDFQMINCTLADNGSNAIKVAEQSSLSLQNTILYNPGYTEYDPLSTGTFTSNGGNLIGDASLANPHVSDVENGNPDFIGSGNYEVNEDSPCIDGGINDGVTAIYDLAGNQRIANGVVDIGAYENLSLSVEEIISGELIITPNPVTDFLRIQFPETMTEPIETSLFDTQGRLISTQFISDGQTIEMGDLPPGMYLLKAMNDEKIYTGIFVKL